ncbi:tetratricopeptide repeat protein [Bacillus sp. NTK074B]|uniref:tetratricopeptide repeat protein n=1 Tax=Bacillus sp. NTK074B TaxID=2802174 RepID=UPI001A8FEE4E|nr:tetratricopeptide repeat protein [Bacillus sp. NTK074B]
MKTLIEEAILLRETGKHEASIVKWKELIKQEPGSGYLHYQCAWSHDAMSSEEEAVPYYEEALRLGLDDGHLQGAYLGLGSTYRTLGNYEESKRILGEGVERFPDNQALKVFYSMVLYNLNEHSRAMELLLTCIGETSEDSGIAPYKKAILFYSERLDKVWK